MTTTLQYAPDGDNAFPWLLSVHGSPLVRVADEDRAVDALQGATHHADAPSAESAVGLALAGSHPGDSHDDGVVGAEDPHQGPEPVVTLHYDQNEEQSLPWVISISTQPVFRLRHGEYAARALQAVHSAHNDEDALDALRRGFATTPTQVEEIAR